MRDSPASVTIASSCAPFSGKNVFNASAADEDAQLCPEGYDGWFGFPATTPLLREMMGPAFRELHRDPRFEQVRKRLGLSY